MGKIRVSAVKYTNSIPFIYGLQNYSWTEGIDLSLDTPAQCFNNILSGNASIGLVPIVLKNIMSNITQITDYGIGASGDVLSVVLVSQSPLKEIKTIYLDYQSRTSVMLARLLCRDYWKISPEFRESVQGFEGEGFKANEARLIIGDRSFQFHKQKGTFVTDLSGEWTKFTGLPFVFAIWASNQKLSEEFEQEFSTALQYGMTHKVRLAKEMATLPQYKAIDLSTYLNSNIIHEISPAMHEGMNLFLHLIRDIQ
jgi:chorismate dehydratase